MRSSPVMMFSAALWAGCGVPPEGALETSGRGVEAEDVSAVVSGERSLALSLYRMLASTSGGNLFFSPHSVATALSIAYAGAAGETQTAFEQVLGSGLSEPTHHDAMGALAQALASRGQGAFGRDGQPFRLRSTNQLFSQSGYALEPAFIDTLADGYGASPVAVDFRGAPERARDAINAWVAQATEGRIDQMIDQVRSDMGLMLVNAVYFNAAWSKPFLAGATRPGDFFRLDGTISRTPFMHQGGLATPAATVGGVEVVELLYDGGELSMVLLMPPAGEFEAFEAGLTPERLDDHLRALTPDHLDLDLPKFETRWRRALDDVLSELGLGVAFTGAADFSRMSSNHFSIGTVLHEAFVRVDENGTEAAAATALSFRSSARPPPPRIVRFDRPFIFLIRDSATGAPVFLGRITDPARGS